MGKEYLLDTNAYFNMLKALNLPELAGQYSEQIELIKQGTIVISSITMVEIISVLGKYARGVNGGYQKCNGIISEDGKICPNSRYVTPRKKWNTRMVKAWVKLVEDIHEGKSDALTIGVLPFDENTVQKAQRIIVHALEHSFGSLDAMIAATAESEKDKKIEVVVITSDKALKQCLEKCSIPFWDAFSR